jgi:hypothetical protein
MASPHVGAAALLLTQACPCIERNIDVLQDILQDTAEHYTTGAPQTRVPGCGREGKNDVPNNVYGYGGIQVERAMKKCMAQCAGKN